MNKTAINSNSLISRNPDIIHTDMDGETVMMNIEQGGYYGLDKTATTIWEMLEDDLTVAQICDRLCEKYDVETQQCQTDTLPFIQDMAEHHVILVR